MGYTHRYDFSKEADRWRASADYWMVSAKAKHRLEWMIFYYQVADKNASYTASYFGISRKTLHKWLSRFNPKQIQSLEEMTKRPKKIRLWEVTPTQEARIIKLRQRYLKYGKAKLKVLYQKKYQIPISTWKIERVVRKHQLYLDPLVHKKKQSKRRKGQDKPKLRIHKMDTNKFLPGRLWHTDTIIVNWYGQRRAIFTACEDKTKIAYARVYPSQTSANAADFLTRLVYLSDNQVTIMHSDNGGEFAGKFKQACNQLGITQIYSRVKQPKDNPALERFNWTLQDEWLAMSEVGLDVIIQANRDLTEWLIEYNFNRPHQSLAYQTPIEYASQHFIQVLPMYPARTGY